jgi:penicillin-binding protein 2
MNPRLRLSVLGVIVVSLFAVLLARLWYLQVLAAPEFVRVAETNRIRFVSEEAPRGRILDRHGRVLVDNRVVNVVTVSRALLDDADEKAEQDREAVLRRLSALLDTPVRDLQRRLADKRFSPYRPIPIAEDVDKSILVYIQEHQDDFPGVEAVRVAQRQYPHGTLLAHVLGYVGVATDRELAEQEGEGYRLGDSIGKAGVEKVYESTLRGEAGITKLQVDARGTVLGVLDERAPQQGDDLRLTIDFEVQRLAEESLQLGLEAARGAVDRETGKHFVAPAGAIVVMDPRDGSLLAIASNPTYEPSLFINGISRQDFAVLQDPANHAPLNNRAIQGLYAPGSTFKLVTALAGLQEGLVNPRTTITDTGVFRIPECQGRCTFRNAGGRQYGRVNLHRALTVSSDVYFYSLGNSFWERRNEFGETAIQDVGELLGLGQRTGVPLPFENAGRVPDPELRRQLHEEKPTAFPEGRWFAGDNVNLAIGQGELVTTPLQLANMYAGVANGGTLYEPRVADAVVDREGEVVRRFGDTITRRLELPGDFRGALMGGLAGAVQEESGTAAAAFAGFPMDVMSVAGKTGTAQVRGKHDTAIFVAAAPVDAPEYVVAVVMEESGFGGSIAAPVARRILDGIAGQGPRPLSYLGATE